MESSVMAEEVSANVVDGGIKEARRRYWRHARRTIGVSVVRGVLVSCSHYTHQGCRVARHRRDRASDGYVAP
jgi:hypothetical protein